MGNLIKYIIIGVAIYYLYKWYQGKYSPEAKEQQKAEDTEFNNKVNYYRQKWNDEAQYFCRNSVNSSDYASCEARRNEVSPTLDFELATRQIEVGDLTYWKSIKMERFYPKASWARLSNGVI